MFSDPLSKSVEITEHESLNFVNTWKMSMDTVEIDRASIREIVPKLINTEKEKIEFEDSLIADKIISLKYSRKPISSERKAISSNATILNVLLRKYKLRLIRLPVDAEAYKIEITDSMRLAYKTKNIQDTVITRRIPYLENEDITLHNVDFKFLAKSMDRFYSKQVVDSTGNNEKYTIIIPRIGFNKLNKYFEDQYGFRFKRISTEVTGYRITSK
jgi:hypothetical protein